MELITTIKLFTILTGAALTGAELIKAADKKEIAKGEIRKDTKELEDLKGNDGLIFAKDIQLSSIENMTGSIIVGPTGTRKTSTLFISNLLENNIRGSIIVTDPKGEIMEKTAYYQEHICNRKILKIDPFTAAGDNINLLKNCKDYTEVQELSNTLLLNGSLTVNGNNNNSEWLQMAEPLLTAALLYAKMQDSKYQNIKFALNLIINLTTDELDIIFNEAGGEVLRTWNIFKSVGEADKTEGGIKITLSSNLRSFINNTINNVFCSDSSFEIEDLRKNEYILYIVYPEHKSQVLAPVMAALMEQLLNRLIETTGNNIYFLVDELCNIGYIPNLDSKASTIRSRNISFNCCTQGISQLIDRYGEKKTNTILNNLTTKIVYESLTDIDSLNYFTTLCGEMKIQTTGNTISTGGSSKSYSENKRKVIDMYDLRCMDKDKLLFITSNKSPIIASKNVYYENEKYLNRIHKYKYNKKILTRSLSDDERINDIKLYCIEKLINNDGYLR